MRYLVIDFETSDPYLSKKRNLGSGWPYKLNVANSDFEILGAAVKSSDGYEDFLTKEKDICTIFNSYENIIMHNAQYDTGCALVCGADVYNKSITLIDTIILAKLHNNQLKDYSLNSLANRFLQSKKNDQELIDTLWKYDLYPYTTKELTDKRRAEKQGQAYIREKPVHKIRNTDKILLEFAKSNMKLLFTYAFDELKQYAIQDARLTEQLFLYLSRDSVVDYKFYSDLIKSCIKSRARGVRVDLDAARSANNKFYPIIRTYEDNINKYVGWNYSININKGSDLVTAFDQLGIKYPRTAPTSKFPDGQPSFKKKWLENQGHPFCKLITELRTINKLQKDFIQKIIEIQKWTCPDAERYGRIYPEFKILGAETDRFTCKGPSVHQIPKRHEQLAPLCRSLFVPEEGDLLYDPDYKGQECRLQIHLAKILRCEGVDEWILKYHNDPHLDLHQEVADLMGVKKAIAKGINFGLAYGMGITKLASQLNVTEQQAQLLKEQYFMMLPFLRSAIEQTRTVAKSRGYIRSFSERKLHVAPATFIDGERREFHYQMFNHWIQRGGAWMIMSAMVEAYRAGLNIMFTVHDEILLTGSQKDAILLKEIMEKCVSLYIPVVVDIDLEGSHCWR